MIYLDHAATTPVAREVADTMYDVLLNGSGNPSSQYPYGCLLYTSPSPRD